jgi:hypothetical protein
VPVPEDAIVVNVKEAEHPPKRLLKKWLKQETL